MILTGSLFAALTLAWAMPALSQDDVEQKAEEQATTEGQEDQQLLGRQANPYLPPWSYGSEIVSASRTEFFLSPDEPLLSFFDCEQAKSTIEVAICSLDHARETFASIIRRAREITPLMSNREREDFLARYTDWYREINEECMSARYATIKARYMESTGQAIIADCALTYAIEWNETLQSDYSDKLSSQQTLLDDAIPISLDPKSEFGLMERFGGDERFTGFNANRSHPIFGGLLPYVPKPDFQEPVSVLTSMAERRDRIALVASYTHDQGYFLSLRTRDRLIKHYDACLGAMRNVKIAAEGFYNAGFVEQQWLTCADGMADAANELVQLARTYEYIAETNPTEN